MERNSGIIMHIASLPGKYGIGTLGEEAYKFADFLEKSGQKYWQILPLGPTSFGDSPYQSFSAFAGNPYFIDFDVLNKKGLLKLEEYENINFGENNEEIDYALIFTEKMKVLRVAFNKFATNISEESEIKNKLDYLIIPIGDTIEYCIKVMNHLQDNGKKVTVYFEESSLKKKMNYANKLDINNVIIIGEDEVEMKEVKIKNMITGESRNIDYRFL